MLTFPYSVTSRNSARKMSRCLHISPRDKIHFLSFLSKSSFILLENTTQLQRTSYDTRTSLANSTRKFETDARFIWMYLDADIAYSIVSFRYLKLQVYSRFVFTAVLEMVSFNGEHHTVQLSCNISSAHFGKKVSFISEPNKVFFSLNFLFFVFLIAIAKVKSPRPDIT